MLVIVSYIAVIVLVALPALHKKTKGRQKGVCYVIVIALQQRNVLHMLEKEKEWPITLLNATNFCTGGEDFDQRVMDYFIKLYKKKKGKDIRSSNRAIQKLRREVEKAKRALSSQHQARIEIESFFEGEDFSETLTRAKFEELNMVGPFF